MSKKPNNHIKIAHYRSLGRSALLRALYVSRSARVGSCRLAERRHCVKMQYWLDFEIQDSIHFIMAIRDDIHEIENKLGFCYPPTFVSCIEELSVLFASEEFRKTFTESSLLLSAPEIAEARTNIPDGLIPFMRDEHPSTSDIYAIEPNRDNTELKVLIWSDHAMVMEWENFLVFRLWIKEQLANHGTVA